MERDDVAPKNKAKILSLQPCKTGSSTSYGVLRNDKFDY